MAQGVRYTLSHNLAPGHHNPRKSAGDHDADNGTMNIDSARKAMTRKRDCQVAMLLEVPPMGGLGKIELSAVDWRSVADDRLTVRTQA